MLAVQDITHECGDRPGPLGGGVWRIGEVVQDVLDRYDIDLAAEARGTLCGVDDGLAFAAGGLCLAAG